MYLRKITLKNIKSFSHLELSFINNQKGINNWTTLFGENGLGKSTLLQAIGAALAGPSAIRELLPVAEGWVRRGNAYGEIIAELIATKGDEQGLKGRPLTKPITARYIVTGAEPDKLPEVLADRYFYTVPTILPWSGEGEAKEKEAATKDLKRLQQTAYAEHKEGWLTCGYGPFRRLSGGGQEADRILYAERISARFITLFREDAALTNTTDWLIKLHNLAREGDRRSEHALQHIKEAFATELFPESVELIVNARSCLLKIDTQEPVSLGDLSDGYRSMLALAIDLLRWLITAFPETPTPRERAGVVLIDELDAHLHPLWQRQIGHWLRQKFPNLQFIVATHSPFLAQVADIDESGLEVHKNSSEVSGNIRLIKTATGVEILKNIEPMHDLRVDQILQTPLFDLDSLYSPITEAKFHRHEELNQEKHTGNALSPDETREYEQLTIWREALPMLTSVAERQNEQMLRQIIHRHRKQLQEVE